ncbi:MAG: HEPN domain-containing protein [Promethearchaeota archaeon]
MGEKEDNEQIVKQLITKGDEKLKSARILIENDHFDDSISRAYYAAYLSCRALMLLLGSTPKTHSGMITMLSLKAIKEDIIPIQIGKDFSQLLEARQNSDYAIFTYYNKEDALNLLEKAQNVVSVIKNVLKNKFNLAPS